MAIIESEERTKLLRKVKDNLLDYEALKLPVSELRVDNSSDSVILNPSLSPDANQVCTWTIPVRSPMAFAQLHEVETGNIVIAPFEVDTELQNNVSYYTLKIFIKSVNTIPAETYRAVVIG